MERALAVAREEMKQARKKLSAERLKVKNANKRKSRLIHKVSKLDENELVEALLYKKSLQRGKSQQDQTETEATGTGSTGSSVATCNDGQASSQSADEPGQIGEDIE